MKKKALIDIAKSELPDRNKLVRERWKFWPSEASCVGQDGRIIGRCMRRIYYEWMGEDITNPVSDFVKTLANIGNFLEDDARNKFKKLKIYPEEANKKNNRRFKVELFKDATLSGEVDILIANEYQNCGVEVKSYSNSTYKVKSEPKEPHLLQAFLYVYFYTPEQPYFMIYYRPSMISKYAESDLWHRVDWVEKNNKVYAVVNGKINKDITIEGIIDRYKLAKKHIESKKLPEREFKKSSKACCECPYKTKCYSKNPEVEEPENGDEPV